MRGKMELFLCSYYIYRLPSSSVLLGDLLLARNHVTYLGSSQSWILALQDLWSWLRHMVIQKEFDADLNAGILYPQTLYDSILLAFTPPFVDEPDSWKYFQRYFLFLQKVLIIHECIFPPLDLKSFLRFPIHMFILKQFCHISSLCEIFIHSSLSLKKGT